MMENITPATIQRVPHDVGEHKLLLEQSEQSGTLAANSPYATVSNPEWFHQFGTIGNLPTRSRIELQKSILEEFRRETQGVPLGRLAIVMAGPPGAGKSKMLKRVQESLAPGAAWREIDPDNFKDSLLRRAYTDGDYEKISPRHLHEDEGRAYLRELAALVHEESSSLAARARTEAIRMGENVVIDGTQKTYDKAKKLIDLLLGARYHVTVVDVEVSLMTSLSRAITRWEKGYSAAESSYLAGRPFLDNLGGRWVPRHCIVEIFPDTSLSVCQRVVGRLVMECSNIRVRVESNN